MDSPTSKILIPVLAFIAILTLAFLGAIVGLEIANRPISSVIELYVAVLVPTLPSFMALVGVTKANHTIENGLADHITKQVTEQAATVAADLVKTQQNGT